MEDLVDPEEMILCPYNSSHHIRRCRMAFHLVKCKKSYTGPPMIPCDFNATHIIPVSESRHHHNNCPDRKLVEVPVVEFLEKSETRFPIPKLDIAIDESWDDVNVPTYDPKTYTENSNVLRHLDVEPKAKKREFRINERHRLSDLSSKNPLYLGPKWNLPPHRSVIDITENTSKPNNMQENEENIKLEGEDCFLNYNNPDE